MPLAAPLIIPFAEIVGITTAGLALVEISEMVQDYIEDNPEESMKVVAMLMPGEGLAQVFQKKAKKPSKKKEIEVEVEEVDVEDVDARDLTKKEKAKKMKELAKSGGGNMREKMIKGYEEIILPGKEDEMLDEAEDRYEGGVEEVSRPKFDWRKFYKKKYAYGGGVQSLFEPTPTYHQYHDMTTPITYGTMMDQRRGFQTGGWADDLTGQALAVYTSMTSGGHDDAAIQAALEAQGLWNQGSTPSANPEQVTGIINQNIGGDGPYAGQVVDQTDYSFNPKNYGPGQKLEVNPEAIGMSFFDSQPGSGTQTFAQSKGIDMNAFNQGDFNQKKDIIEKAGLDFNMSTLEKLDQPQEKGFMESFMGAAVPSKQFSEFRSPGTGDVLKGPAEQGFMSQNIEGIPGNLTREDLRSMYDDYNTFFGRPSNYKMARVPGTFGNLVNMIPYMGPIKRGAEALFGPQGDKSLRSKYAVDNAGFGNTGTRDEFGLSLVDDSKRMFGKQDRNYLDRMEDQMDKNIDFFGGTRTSLFGGKELDKKGSSVNLTVGGKTMGFKEAWDSFDDLDTTAQQALIDQMKAINGFKTKQMLAYKNRLATEKINTDWQKKQAEIEAAKKAAESRKKSAELYDPNVHGPTNYGLGSDGQQSYDLNPGSGVGWSATGTGPVSNKTGRGRTDWADGGRVGLASMFVRKR